MATTTFTGPIKAGTVLATTGNTVGKYKNVGTVSLQQISSKINHDDNASGLSGVTIPANSAIFGIEFFVDELFANSNGSTTVLNVGTSADSDYVVDGAALSATVTAGICSPAAANRWTNVGTTDMNIYSDIEAGNATAGELYLVVTYIQNANLA